jgi:RNA polymerase sporulation-specific sigma factor
MDTQAVKEKSTYDKNPELILRYRAGDAAAGEELVRLNFPLVYSIAQRFRERVADMSDAIECGELGLVKAINTFDISRGCAFSTYAVPLIFGEIRRFLRDDGMIKVSREEKRLGAILNRVREERIAEGERSDIASIAAAVGISVADAASALCAESPVRSFEESVYDDDDSTTLGSTIYDDEEEVRRFESLSLALAIERLEELERKIVILRYFRDLSQTEVAKMLGLSQVKVSRAEKRIMCKLREYME